MVRLTRLNGTELWLNPVLMESIEATPDCVVTMSNGHKYVIREKPEEVQASVLAFYRQTGLITAAVHKGERE